jgi:hypothetical protein
VRRIPQSSYPLSPPTLFVTRRGYWTDVGLITTFGVMWEGHEKLLTRKNRRSTETTHPPNAVTMTVGGTRFGGVLFGGSGTCRRSTLRNGVETWLELVFNPVKTRERCV